MMRHSHVPREESPRKRESERYDPQGDLLEHVVHQLPVADDVVGDDPEPAVVVPHDGDERLVVAAHGRGEDVGVDLLGPLDARQTGPSLPPDA